MRAGLPQHHAHDLAYRHGLAVADDGRQLRMTRTIGGLWAGADAGERWETLSLSLPPAVAMRFG